ncbi:RagB/SusD family nutrient uptake outer membrane protein [Epilithonimonas tenax]|uniref:RagB/SusD family nutrient uptake outer membrane protein n=1 Tax=Epilithonimonas tenax TaxID=191577 RepID=UPI0003FCF477|nr:RagB/SusD family nutrient uptake outer membrane protein [Epilithonimonas tenax]
MKKFFIILSSLLVITANNSCSDKELELYPTSLDDIQDIDTEDKLQKFLNAGYLTIGSVNVFGTDAMAIADVLSDNAYITSAKAYNFTSNMNYSALNNDTGGLYRSLYDAIMNCNMVINNTKVANSANVSRIKGEAKIMRAFSYFTLLNYFSPAPTSGINQEYGVPLVLENYDSSIQPARATVAEVYAQIISDLNAGLADADAEPAGPDGPNKVFMSKAAAKLILSRVYLTRRAPGDAQLALQYSTEIVNLKNTTGSNFAPISKDNYVAYFAGSPEEGAENQPETIWELDMNPSSNLITGVGSNLALPTLYNRVTTDRRAILFTKAFFDSFPHIDLTPLANGTPQSTSPDVRRGNTKTSAPTLPAGLMSTLTLPAVDNPVGAWTNKYPRLTGEGNFFRNIKIFRFAEAQLNRIEALFLTGQSATALAELNAFALSRGGATYTGTNLLNDILTEKAKEFYGEGQRFYDLKRHNLPLIKGPNCVMNCNVPANDKLFVMPISQSALNYNPNLKQYPGY